MTPQELMQRGERARQLLEEPMIRDALNLIEQEVIGQWSACPARDVEGREELWKLYKTAQKFRGVLQSIMESGKLSAHQLQSKKTIAQRFNNLRG